MHFIRFFVLNFSVEHKSVFIATKKETCVCVSFDVSIHLSRVGRESQKLIKCAARLFGTREYAVILAYAYTWNCRVVSGIELKFLLKFPLKS